MASRYSSVYKGRKRLVAFSVFPLNPFLLITNKTISLYYFPFLPLFFLSCSEPPIYIDISNLFSFTSQLRVSLMSFSYFLFHESVFSEFVAGFYLLSNLLVQASVWLGMGEQRREALKSRAVVLGYTTWWKKSKKLVTQNRHSHASLTIIIIICKEH